MPGSDTAVMEDICLKSKDITEFPEEMLHPNLRKLDFDFNDVAVIPPNACKKLSNLSFLSMNGNMLNSLPCNIGGLTALTELYLKENLLHSLPETIGQLKSLKKLYLTGNQLNEMPESFCNLQNLTELIADENKIERLPDSFGNLKSLAHMNLSCNALKALPENFGGLSNLKELDLSNNLLKNLPDSFQHLPCLEVLDLSGNAIKELPDSFASSKTLIKFFMAENQLSLLPSWFSKLESIKHIFLSDNDLRDMPFPENFGVTCGNLEKLDLSGNNINILPETIGKLHNLTFLDLGSPLDELERNRMIANGNDLSHLPSTFCDLKSLTKLELDENLLVELPSDFGFLANLIYLDLGHNMLQHLPDSFCDLLNLKVCMLSMNHLKELPLDFGKLVNIEDLKLDNNLLSSLPDSFENLTAVIGLDLYKNSFKEIPSVLNKLKSLKRLDLRENDFGLELEDVPEVSYEPKYVARNPEYDGNWKGRKRHDITNSAWVEKKEKDSNAENLQNGLLFNAMSSSSAMWRKHGQADVRSKAKSSPVSVASAECEKLDESLLNGVDDDEHDVYHQNEDCGSDVLNSSFQSQHLELDSTSQQEEDYWDDDLLDVPLSSSPTLSAENDTSCSKSDFDPDDLSDWENDMDFEFPNTFGKVYRHPVEDKARDMNMLIPSDFHAPPIAKKEVWNTFDEGQFDDVDDL